MPRSFIQFRVPQDFARLQGPIVNFPGECDDIDYENLEDLDARLHSLIGTMLEIEFDEPDPSEPIDLLIRALKETGAPYLAMYESYTEPSRGDRFQARILVRTDDFEGDRQYPWAEGEPSVSDPACWRTAGFTEDQVRSIEATFFQPAQPRPA